MLILGKAEIVLITRKNTRDKARTLERWGENQGNPLEKWIPQIRCLSAKKEVTIFYVTKNDGEEKISFENS